MSKVVSKADLVAAVAEAAGITKKDAATAVATVFSTVEETLVAGGKVQVLGFGTFEVRDRAAREGHNPATGAKIQIAASKAPAFKAGKGLKDAVNK
ncbi:MAG: HU family DNA-binding protein [Lactobacillales bacterium]|nr:HU family DNA-binding protein [Lactobacillales bacterium]